MTRSQAQWARRHDWFDDAVCFDGEWTVGTKSQCRDLYTDGTASEWRTEYHTFTNFDELRAWAGY